MADATLGKRRPVNVWRSDTDPTVDEDFDAGYIAGDLWQNVDTEALFWLADDTAGAAVWVEVSGGGGALDDDLDAIAALTGTGFLVRTAADTWALRTLQEGSGIDLTNPAGTAGDPTITAPNTLYARVSKTSDTSRNTTTTMSADPHLTISLPTGYYAFRGDVYAWGDANADWKVSMTTSNAADLMAWHWNLGNVFTPLLRNFTGLNYSLPGTGISWPDNGRILQVGGLVEIVSGPHDVFLTWAQQTSTGTDVTVKKGSWLEFWEVGV